MEQSQHTDPSHDATMRWVKSQPRSDYASDAYLVDSQGRILGEVGPALDIGYEAKVDRQRLGHFLDQSSAMQAVESSCKQKPIEQRQAAPSNGVGELLDAIRDAGVTAVRTDTCIRLIKTLQVNPQAMKQLESSVQEGASVMWNQPAVVPRLGGAPVLNLRIGHGGFGMPDAGSDRLCQQGNWTVEPHGKGWAIYTGRDSHHHGANWGQLSECDEQLAKLIERGLNALKHNPSAPQGA